MAAPDHLQPQQLAMFMPAQDLFEMHSFDTAGYDGVAQMRRIKRSQNRMSGLVGHVAEHGVQQPVQIAHAGDRNFDRWIGGHQQAVANGNHRVLAAYDHDPRTEVPVEHHDKDRALKDSMMSQDLVKWRR